MAIILSPRPASGDERATLAPRLQRLGGAVLGLRIQWDNFELLLDRVLDSLDPADAPSDIVRWKAAPERGRHTRTDAEYRREQFEGFCERIDGAILGLAA